MKQAGFISLIILLITILILALLFISYLSSQEKKGTYDKHLFGPQRIEQTQDIVDEFQQKSIERQTIEIE